MSVAQKKSDINSVKQKIAERDKLNAEITKAVENIFEKEKGFLMKETLDSLNNEIAKRQSENRTLQDKNAELQKKIIDLSIKIKGDSLSQIGNQKKAEELAFQKGEISTINKLSVYYNCSLDEIINKTNKDILERDLVFFAGNNEFSSKLKSAIEYFNIKNSLLGKLTTLDIQQAKERLKNLSGKEGSANITSLTESLDLYTIYKEITVNFLKRIKANDLVDTAGFSRNFQEDKKKTIKAFSAEFFNHEYIITLFEFKFLHGIYNELMTRKMENPDAEIADLLKKLEE